MVKTDQKNAQPTRVILVRHGRSTFNDQGRYQGSSNESVLTEKGQEMARQVGVVLNGLSIDALYTSPLKRVQQTVDTIFSTMQQDRQSIPIYQTRQLREIDLLSWEGRLFHDVAREFAEAYRCWKQRPHEFQLASGVSHPTTGEGSIGQSTFYPVIELYDRAQRFWQSILPRHRGQTLLVVGHGGTNHALISTALGLSAAHHHTLQQSNCGVSVLEFSDGKLNPVTVRSLNLTHHLGETLPKLKEGKQGLRLLLVPTVTESRQTQLLSEQLKTIPIHFWVSSNFHHVHEQNAHEQNAHEIVSTLLCHHPTAVQLQTSQRNFVDLWQQSLTQRNTHSPDLITGLGVSCPETIQYILKQAIGLNSMQGYLAIQPGTISVLHYPSAHQRPVLQVLNQGGAISYADRVESSESPHLAAC